ncbi:hypothetical protein RvY_02083-1 [Ramazzottius varieornatus]|uniref:Uncharacterized protein n=1 Tax=Ramazzottius varieornatus TaxID=947166 RepID=A0A1D1UJC5_RAMVA|nr:hypothetical protein RvY_02083-1 [Ramazzottius varieornatus]
METSAFFRCAVFSSLGLIAVWHIHRSYPFLKLIISIQTFNEMPFEHFTEFPRVATEPRNLTVLHPEYLVRNYDEVQELPCYKEWSATPVLLMRTFFLFALQNISLIFIGDSRINHLFFTLRAMLLPYEYPVQTRPRVGECESHLDIRSHNSSIHYYRSKLPDRSLANVLTMIHSDKRWQLRRTYILYECGAVGKMILNVFL